MELWSAVADVATVVARSFGDRDTERYVPCLLLGRYANCAIGEIKVPATVDGDTVALVDSMEMKSGNKSFQPNPFWGSQAHLVRR